MAKLAPQQQGPFWLRWEAASQKVLCTLVDETDLATFETGVASPTIELSKNGGAYAAASDGTWAEISDGDYTITLDATDTDTQGPLMIRVVKSGTAAETRLLCYVSMDLEQHHATAVRVRSLVRG